MAIEEVRHITHVLNDEPGHQILDTGRCLPCYGNLRLASIEHG